MLYWVYVLLISVGTLILGIILGVVIANKKMKKHIENNPPINEQQIRAMYAQMGRKPSEAQVKAVMQQYKKHK